MAVGKNFDELTIAELFYAAANTAHLYYKECTDPDYPDRHLFPLGLLESNPVALRFRVEAVQQNLDRILELAKEIDNGRHNTTTD